MKREFTIGLALLEMCLIYSILCPQAAAAGADTSGPQNQNLRGGSAMSDASENEQLPTAAERAAITKPCQCSPFTFHPRSISAPSCFQSQTIGEYS